MYVVEIWGLMERLTKLKKVLSRKGLDIEYLMLDSPDYQSKIDDLEEKYKKHPAFEQWRFMTARAREEAKEGLAGIAVGREKAFFHFGPREKKIALLTVGHADKSNKLGHIIRVDTALGHVVLDSYPEIKKKLSVSSNPAINKTVYHLFAQIFAFYYYGTENGISVFKHFLRERSKCVFQRRMGYDPRQDMSPLFMGEILHFLTKEQLSIIETGKQLNQLVDKIYEILEKLDNRQVITWHNFCASAQDMSWRGFSPREVLTAAVSGSESPFFQSIGRQLAKNIGIKISDQANSTDMDFNAFGSHEDNKLRHARMMKKTMMLALEKLKEEGDTKPFREQANEQNEQLLEGRFVGWCARALQSAASLYDEMIADESQSQHEIQAAIKDHFLEDISREDYSWGTLKEFSDRIVDEIRDGNIVTYSKASKIANDNALEILMESINMSLNSPEMQAKLNNVEPEAPKGPSADAPKPEGPAPKAPKQAPAMQAGPATPGLGGRGGGRGGRRSSQRAEHASDKRGVADNEE